MIKNKGQYYTYMLRCEDNTIYTGITNNLNRRMEEHFLKGKNGAKYTKSHNALKVEVVWKSKEKSYACSLEAYIKQLKKEEKEELIKTKILKNFLKGKVDCRKYRVIDIKEILDKKYYNLNI